MSRDRILRANDLLISPGHAYEFVWADVDFPFEMLFGHAVCVGYAPPVGRQQPRWWYCRDRLRACSVRWSMSEELSSCSSHCPSSRASRLPDWNESGIDRRLPASKSASALNCSVHATNRTDASPNFPHDDRWAFPWHCPRWPIMCLRRRWSSKVDNRATSSLVEDKENVHSRCGEENENSSPNEHSHQYSVDLLPHDRSPNQLPGHALAYAYHEAALRQNGLRLKDMPHCYHQLGHSSLRKHRFQTIEHLESDWQEWSRQSNPSISTSEYALWKRFDPLCITRLSTNSESLTGT